jgi:hypothetical protein
MAGKCAPVECLLALPARKFDSSQTQRIVAAARLRNEKNSFPGPAWTDLTDVTASTNTAVFSEMPDPVVTQKFYRATIVN